MWKQRMLLFCGLMNLIHVLATAQAPENTSDAETFITVKEAVIAPRFSKIIGGIPAVSDDFPPIAALVTRRESTISECTGTVLNNRFVLTAGHCIEDAVKITIYIGCAELYYCRENKPGEGILHPRYDKVNNLTYNDIGLVRSISTFSTTAYALLSGVSMYYEGCVVMGYGFTSDNLEIQNTRLHALKVLYVIPCTYYFEPELANHMISTMVCSMAEDSRRYSFGDSGGPLLCKNTQVGVSSQLMTFKLDGKLHSIMFWVPVGLYIEWIQTVMSCSSHPNFTTLFAVLLLFLIQFVN